LLAAVAWAVVGVLWVYKFAVAGNVLGAVAAAGLCLAVIILDCVAASVLRLGGVVLRTARRIEQVERRIATVEAVLEEQIEAIDLAAAGRGDPGPILAANLDGSTFPRLLTDEDEEAPADEGYEAAPATPDEELDLMVRSEMNRLRDDFAGFVRIGDYAAAIRTGERIVTLFPDSHLAEDFQSLRELLLQRTSSATRDDQASAI
jgi:hypothetical protein